MLLLEDFGMLEGRDFVVDRQCTDGTREHAETLAQKLIEANPDVIVAVDEVLASLVKRRTDRIPIVMLFGPDPIAQGWARSYGRPGGNLTGSTYEIGLDESITEKFWQMIWEIHPRAQAFVHLEMGDHPIRPPYDVLRDRIGKQFGVKIHTVVIPSRAAIQETVRRTADLKPGAMLIGGEGFIRIYRNEILKEAVAMRVPIYVWTSQPIETGWPGVVMGFMTDVSDQPRRAAEYVAKILRGAKPGDLPIVRPTKTILQVNLKVARELGITIPPTVLLRADRVIE
jgi:putative ABC transport system substrate-binding protein